MPNKLKEDLTQEDLTQKIVDIMLDKYKDDKYAMTVALGYMNLITSTREILIKLEDKLIDFMEETYNKRSNYKEA